MKPAQLAVFFLIFGALVAVIDNTLGRSEHGQASLVISLIYFIAVAHGAVAIVAAAELCKGKWVQPVKKYLFSLIPFMLFASVMVLFLYPQLEMYETARKTHPTYFSKPFFILRSVIFMLITFGLAWKYAQESNNDGVNRGLFGVLYLFFFAVTQTTLCIDWVMALGFPWISTLMGAFYFVQAIYMAMCTSAFVCFFLYKKYGADSLPAGLPKAQYDTGVIMLGFSVLYMYMFFAHLITIWYGNLPGENDLFVDRQNSPFREIGIICLAFCWITPFILLQFQKIKRNPRATTGIALLVCAGIFLERIWFVRPLAEISWAALALNMVLFGILFVIMIRGAMTEGEGKAEAKAA